MSERPTKEPVVMITLRVPPWLHRRIANAAHAHLTSMNQYCSQVLQEAVAGQDTIKGVDDVTDSEIPVAVSAGRS